MFIAILLVLTGTIQAAINERTECREWQANVTKALSEKNAKSVLELISKRPSPTVSAYTKTNGKPDSKTAEYEHFAAQSGCADLSFYDAVKFLISEPQLKGKGAKAILDSIMAADSRGQVSIITAKIHVASVELLLEKGLIKLNPAEKIELSEISYEMDRIYSLVKYQENLLLEQGSAKDKSNRMKADKRESERQMGASLREMIYELDLATALNRRLVRFIKIL